MADRNPVHENPQEESLRWEEVSTEHLVQDEWIDFRRSAFRFPDGRIFQPYYSFTRRDYAVIVASDEEGRYICVRQFRQGIREVTTEFPAGAIEKKDGASPEEAALEAAKRELREETGYVSDHWRPLLTIPSNATISDNYAWLFAAEKCRPAAAQQLRMSRAPPGLQARRRGTGRHAFRGNSSGPSTPWPWAAHKAAWGRHNSRGR